jgi:4-hydroxy-3-polyprenylbenzoate decarboxylase
MREIKDLLIAITGASGTIYADRLLHSVVAQVPHLGLVLTPQGAEIAAHELGWAVNFDALEITGPSPAVLERVRLYHPDDLYSRYASGSAAPDAMIVIPCSAGAAGRIAAGMGDTLLSRAAAVCLKERRPLVLVVRESPLGLIDLRNLVRLTEAGAVVMPASPAFYTDPKDLEELADSFVARVLDQIGLRLDQTGEREA